MSNVKRTLTDNSVQKVLKCSCIEYIVFLEFYPGERFVIAALFK